MREKSGGKKPADAFVLTPGGFRPRHSAREVKPGEVVRFDTQGKMVIVQESKDKLGESKEGGSDG